MTQEERIEVFKKWWKDLQNNNAARAELRRCSNPFEVAIHPEAYRLKWELPSWISMECIATLAGVASHIKQDGGDNFALSLGKSKDGGGQPPFSEIRFRQLLKSRNWDELYKNLRRAVSIVDGVVNLDSFFNLLLDWDREFKGTFSKPGKTVKYQMAEDYYKEAL